ncbi:MAG TPA: secretin N-terminal domain-containing protein, partial [Pyrinomonadaceae bacterium]|nr:secretin N-terminal domain-containing protein [Pyrinomonadaceae bacterium]
MKSFARARSFVALLMVAMLLASPLVALAKKGEKNYKRGLEYETAQQWDKAAQEFALAVAARPSDTEYQLHYRRAIFNASQTYMQKGRELADRGDYVGAYNAFRQAYGYDSVNDLAASEMERVLRLQREKEGLGNGETRDKPGTKVSPTSYRSSAAPNGVAATPQEIAQTNPRAEQLTNITYNNQDLESVIRSLADQLNLNVVFDRDFGQQKRTITIRLKDVTVARALDHIFLSYGLFFQKLDRRTILVADQSKRPQYQQLVLRTFYLSNIDPNDARQLIQAALPANAGRQPQVVTNKTTNSITVRDTPENVRIIGELLQSVDKDRAEVVMEVSIYEVSRKDLLQIGNQFGTSDTLGNLGGFGAANLGGRDVLSGAAGSAALPSVLAGSIIIPAMTISALQSKDNTRLVFQTQVHAFDDEKSETRIGAKVPVQTASVFSGLTTGTGTGTGGTGTGGTASSLFGNGYPVIQYEDTGLSLDFTPKVFPNQDVQVKMVIETKDAGVSGSGAASALTPTFSQRRITGVARIPNGKTMMIASIAQDRETAGRAGLPFLSGLPFIGRLFSTPLKNNSTSDVVITMTPRVLRAPSITPRDEETRPSGSMQTPTTESLEALMRDADRDDALAAARRLPTTQTVQLPAPPGEEVSYVPAPKALAEGAASNPAAAGTTADTKATPAVTNAAAVNVSNKSVDTTAAANASKDDKPYIASLLVADTGAQSSLNASPAINKTAIDTVPAAKSPENMIAKS